MKTTTNFNYLSTKAKELINEFGNGIPQNLKALPSDGNRSLTYELVGEDIILKVLKPKGKRDSDIQALLDLDGIEYFPKLYAYQEGKFLFMEKAQGTCIPELIKAGITDTELKCVKIALLDAQNKMIDRKRVDADLKLEHFFWSQHNQKLTWIDLGINDKFDTLYPSREYYLNNLGDFYSEQLEWYGRKI